MTVIHKKWAEFERAVIDPNVSDKPRHCMKAAFYSGADAMLDLVTMLAEADEKTVQDYSLYKDWADELGSVLGRGD